MSFYNYPSDWMSHLDENFSLIDVCMPGSHDAGMYSTKHLYEGPFLTQSVSIERQLECGVRYFDLRPRVTKKGGQWTFYVYHGDAGFFESVAVGDGPNLEEILGHIAGFMKAHTGETVIANFSHFMDIGGETAELLLKLLKKYLGPYLPDTQKHRVASLTPLKDLRGKVIVRIEDFNFYLEQIHCQQETGFYFSGESDWFPNLRILDDYSDKRDYQEMLANQAMKFNRFSSPGELFMLNWTLTPKGGSVKGYAQEVNPKLWIDRQKQGILLPNPHGRIINIINADYVGSFGLSPLDACEYVMNNRLNTARKFPVRLTSSATKHELFAANDSVKPAKHDKKIEDDGDLDKWSRIWALNADVTSSQILRVTSLVTGQCLSSADGKISLADPDSSDAQKWQGKHVQGTTLTFQATATNQCLDGNESAIYLHEGNGGTHQQWDVEPWAAVPKPGSLGHRLEFGTMLGKDQFITPPNELGTLRMQQDGNLVLYDRSGSDKWSSGTQGSNAEYATIDDKGDLLVLKADGTIVWKLSQDALFFSPQKGSALVLENGLLMQMVAPTGNSLWNHCSARDRSLLRSGEEMDKSGRRVSRNGKFELVLQEDGNLVVYNLNGAKTPIWASKTHEFKVSRLKLAADGNLTITPYANDFYKTILAALPFLPDRQPTVWNIDSSWPRHAGSSLRILDSGKLAFVSNNTAGEWTNEWTQS